MADFDNGLPPAGTTTDGGIKSVSFDKSVAVEENIYQAKAILLDKSDAQEFQPEGVKAVLINKSAAGMNYGTFL